MISFRVSVSLVNGERRGHGENPGVVGFIEREKNPPAHCVDAINPRDTNLSWLILSAKLRMKDLKIGRRCGALSGVRKNSTKAFVS